MLSIKTGGMFRYITRSNKKIIVIVLDFNEETAYRCFVVTHGNPAWSGTIRYYDIDNREWEKLC